MERSSTTSGVNSNGTRHAEPSENAASQTAEYASGKTRNRREDADSTNTRMFALPVKVSNESLTSVNLNANKQWPAENESGRTIIQVTAPGPAFAGFQAALDRLDRIDPGGASPGQYTGSENDAASANLTGGDGGDVAAAAGARVVLIGVREMAATAAAQKSQMSQQAPPTATRNDLKNAVKVFTTTVTEAKLPLPADYTDEALNAAVENNIPDDKCIYGDMGILPPSPPVHPGMNLFLTALLALLTGSMVMSNLHWMTQRDFTNLSPVILIAFAVGLAILQFVRLGVKALAGSLFAQYVEASFYTKEESKEESIEK